MISMEGFVETMGNALMIVLIVIGIVKLIIALPAVWLTIKIAFTSSYTFSNGIARVMVAILFVVPFVVMITTVAGLVFLYYRHQQTYDTSFKKVILWMILFVVLDVPSVIYFLSYNQ